MVQTLAEVFGGPPLKWLIVAEVLDPEVHDTNLRYLDSGLPWWESLGLLETMKVRTQALIYVDSGVFGEEDE